MTFLRADWLSVTIREHSRSVPHRGDFKEQGNVLAEPVNVVDNKSLIRSFQMIQIVNLKKDALDICRYRKEFAQAFL